MKKGGRGEQSPCLVKGGWLNGTGHRTHKSRDLLVDGSTEKIKCLKNKTEKNMWGDRGGEKEKEANSKQQTQDRGTIITVSLPIHQ